MAVRRKDVSFDVSEVIPSGNAATEAALTGTVVFDPERVVSNPTVVIGVPGGTYHRRYWDLQPPGRSGYSKAEYLADRGKVFLAVDYLGGGDSSRPEDGDFIGLEVQADAAHLTYRQARERVAAGSLAPGLPPGPDATFVGIGQSLGGFITMVQQDKYADFSAIGVFGASPKLITGVREQPDWDTMSLDERRAWVIHENARQSGAAELEMYHGAPREQYRGIFHVPDVPDDLVHYDEQWCHTLIPRFSGVDGMTPGFARPFAERITAPLFLAFGELDVSAAPHREPAAYPSSPDITLVVIPRMAHMHNFADTRTRLWERFHAWLPAVTQDLPGRVRPRS
jgi:dienelactone hydrolase